MKRDFAQEIVPMWNIDLQDKLILIINRFNTSICMELCRTSAYGDL
jgi:hypothetical protein